VVLVSEQKNRLAGWLPCYPRRVIRVSGWRRFPVRADGPLALRVYFRGRRLRGGSPLSPAAANSIAQAIQSHEGYYPGTIAYTNNNPGNLVYAGQAGASPGGAGGFASFGSYQDGYNAMVNQIQLDVSRGTDVNGNPVTNISQLINSWAPVSQNGQKAVDAYVSDVAGKTGFDPTTPFSSLGDPAASSSVYVADAAPSSDIGDASSFTADLATAASSTVDLSSIGGPSDVSGPLLVAAGLVGFLVLSRL
jgi:hypothetical protein